VGGERGRLLHGVVGWLRTGHMMSPTGFRGVLRGMIKTSYDIGKVQWRFWDSTATYGLQGVSPRKDFGLVM